MLRPLFPRKFPWIPATDVAGEVIDVGPGVNNFKVGDKVVSMLDVFVSYIFTLHSPILVVLFAGGNFDPFTYQIRLYIISDWSD
ncbi:putative GroES-like superfamily, alcohol dehydrogenase [Helianthus annuus]|uniref:GroES-like superfamily, alcohol dehydrogenase n=1 Tax=Helianthus annuus TaxID=4232 RepID=A0A251V0R1_HELAN|nr:putative GroES-like superfamily, alcohol dehydrogenase [Helianthus annuus]